MGLCFFTQRKARGKTAFKDVIYGGSTYLAGISLYLGCGLCLAIPFHYPCPGCGITRACVALVHGDFKAAFEYNYMFISLPIIFAYILFDGRIFKSKKIDYTILSIIMFGFLIHWILTLCNY